MKPTPTPFLALPCIAAGTVALLIFGALEPTWISSWFPANLTGQPFVDARLKVQIVTFPLALLILAITAVLAPHNARRFYRAGQLNAPAEPDRWLDIKPGDRWGKVGTSFAVIVSLATAAFVYFNIARGQSLEPGSIRFLPYVLILAAMNAFTEEAITRLSVVTALDGLISRPVIYLVSALIFGIPHFYGIPGGLLGSLMAGFLGWLLARSIAETQGVFWAWLIHFLQDVIIFSALFLVAL
jgi:membrane protease YdiL (CAAX protease family)